MKTYLWLLFFFLLVPPVFTFLSSQVSVPHFLSLSSSHLSAPLFTPFPSFFTFLSLSRTPFFPLLSIVPLFLHSVIYLLLCVGALHSRRSQWCPSQQHRSGNESLPPPPSGAQWHGALLSPGSVGAEQSGMEIGRCGSRLVWRDHHGTSSACNVGWHTADCGAMGAGSES